MMKMNMVIYNKSAPVPMPKPKPTYASKPTELPKPKIVSPPANAINLNRNMVGRIFNVKPGCNSCGKR